MTTRQYRLYDFLKKCYEANPERWIPQKEICFAVSGYNYIEEPYGTTDHCSVIGDDVRAINADMTIDKLIVVSKYRFKIADEIEAQKEIDSHTRRLISQAVQIANFNKKIGRNGQCKLFNEFLNELNESNEQVHETFYRNILGELEDID